MVEEIRALCKQQGISLTKLEQKLGFGNGVIGRWDKSKPSYDRIVKVADALGVSVSDITGEGIKKEPTPNWDELKPEDIKSLLERMSRDQLLDVIAAATNIAMRKGDEQK